MDMVPRKNKSCTHTQNFFVFFLSESVMAVGDHLLQAITHPGDELWTGSDIAFQD